MQSKLDFSLGPQVPVILQAEAAECGLACIAMVSSFLGHKLDILSLRQRFDVSLKGLTLKHLIELAARCGIASRAVRCEIDEIKQIRLPAVLHWNLNHFVVLTKIGVNGVWIHDPANGRRKVSYRELSEKFTGIALEVQRSRQFKKANDTQTMSIRQLWSRINHFYRTIGLLFVLSLLLQVIAVSVPYYMQWVIDHVILTSDQDLLFVLAVGFGLLMLSGACMTCLRSWLVLRLASSMNLHMGVNLLNHLLRLPLGYFQKRHVGDVVSRFSSLGQVRERMTTGVVETFVDGVMSVLMLAIMLVYSIELTSLVLVAISAFVVVRAIAYGPLYRLSEQAVQASATEQTSFLENIRAIQTIKLFGAESSRLGIWQNQYTNVINSEIRIGKMNIGFGFANALIFGLENILIVYFAAQEVLAMNLSVGMMLAFLAYKAQLTARLTNLVEQWIAFRMLRLHLNRLADIALTEAEPNNGFQGLAEGQERPMLNRASKLPEREAIDLTIESLGYRYGDQDSLVLDDVNVTVPAGSMLAVVGPSGGGKTTLLKLMLGLVTPTSGRVIYNGVDTQHMSANHYRQRTATVMQDDQLLSGSVNDNICFFDLQPDHERIRGCAVLAEIHEDIECLPMGYQSLVGDMGSIFSGGQIQRLLLARALYRQPAILFLDEATSHLDDLRARRVTDAINVLGMTRIVVAHRLSTIKAAHQILLVRDNSAEVFTPEQYFLMPQDNSSPKVRETQTG